MGQDLKQAKIWVSGRVQGVFFRSQTKSQADKLDLTGWVRNLPNGYVEIVACGKEENLKKLIQWCKRGSTLAKVEKIEVNWEEPKEFFNGFEIIY